MGRRDKKRRMKLPKMRQDKNELYVNACVHKEIEDTAEAIVDGAKDFHLTFFEPP